MSLDIPWSLCPVVAMLELIGICVTLALPRVTVNSFVSGNFIVAGNLCGASLNLAFGKFVAGTG